MNLENNYVNLTFLLQIYLVVGVFGLTTFAEAQETNSAEVVFLGQLKQDTLSTIGQTRYYKLIMTAGLEVTLTLNPTGFDAKLLVYRANSVDEISKIFWAKAKRNFPSYKHCWFFFLYLIPFFKLYSFFGIKEFIF